MKNIKKIKIKVNGKFKSVPEKYKISDLVKDLKIPLQKVAIELNQEIMDKKKINKIHKQGFRFIRYINSSNSNSNNISSGYFNSFCALLHIFIFSGTYD